MFVVFPFNWAAGSDVPIEDRDGSEHYADARARLLAFVKHACVIIATRHMRTTSTLINHDDVVNASFPVAPAGLADG